MIGRTTWVVVLMMMPLVLPAEASGVDPTRLLRAERNRRKIAEVGLSSWEC